MIRFMKKAFLFMVTLSFLSAAHGAATKTPTKTPVKSSTKAAAKALAKPVAKAPAKAPTKTATQAPAKPAAKVPAKPAAAPAPVSKAVMAVAVSELQIREGVQQGKAALLSDILRSELLATEKFEVMNREDMDAVLRELKFQQSGVCDATSCLVEMGQALGVSKMVGGSVGKLGEKYAITLKLVDLKTQKNEKSFTEYYQGAEEDLDQVMRYVAKKLAGLQLAPLQVKASPRRAAPARKGSSAQEETRPRSKKNAILAASMSLAVPGLGQFYNGQNVYKASLMTAAGGSAQVLQFLSAAKGRIAQDEYDVFMATPWKGLSPHEGSELSEFDYWAEEYDKARRNVTIYLVARAVVSVYSSLDAFVYAKKYRSGQARGGWLNNIEVSWGPQGPRASLHLAFGKAGSREN